ncbi:MAG: glycosyltransferase [Patescibacteria group bacterium]|jgi:glycosyltransferase involved in cell wall biosynthesis
MKLAIVYDWIDSWGGAERILSTLFDLYPAADIYTLYADYRKAVWAKKYSNRIKTTFLQSWYNLVPHKQFLAPFMPYAIESLNLSAYDVVLSISSAFAKGVLTRPETKHISYIFAPTRFLWHEKERYTNHGYIAGIVKWLQDWDKIASKRPDKILTLSKHTQHLLSTIYYLPSTVVYPPFDMDYYENLKRNSKKPSISLPQNYFLFVGRLEPYKRIDLLTDAFSKMPHQNLVIIGSGSELPKIRKSISNFNNITVYSNLSDFELAYVYRHATALLMPQSEDFGYTALESVFFKTPVMSYAKSGVAEFVRNKGNGILFSEQTASEIVKQVEKFRVSDYNMDTSVVEMFSKKKFITKIKQQISN